MLSKTTGVPTVVGTPNYFPTTINIYSHGSQCTHYQRGDYHRHLLFEMVYR
jgi:hypothetical protein